MSNESKCPFAATHNKTTIGARSNRDWWPNTKLEFNAKNHALQILIHRAEIWLKENSYKNPIQKWETESWGEIPADFGRK